MTAIAFRNDDQRAAYQSILQAEPGLRAVERVILALAGYDSTDVYLYAVKPLIHDLVGHGRGIIPTPAPDHVPEDLPVYAGQSLVEFMATPPPPRVQATTETETYLRSSAAWDTVTDVWLDYLQRHDDDLPLPNRKDTHHG